ncbi:hypothetical protein HU200_016872 [Digitaria exilis]|uniref:Dirigent protein n=1 Tax=Digitaria exilis TaxID=1010633 RepID=A0A835KKT3_9POAL|nr:hypothetical protein HU200_016872 [Digitaria exilis]
MCEHTHTPSSSCSPTLTLHPQQKRDTAFPKSPIAMAPSSKLITTTLPLFLTLLAALTSSTPHVVTAGDNHDGDLTHIHLYVHERHGHLLVDDELRLGPDRRSSPLVGRYQGVFFGTSLEVGAGYVTAITLVFTAGEHAGSTLSVQGPVLGFTGTIERAVVGGTGKFRLARGYMLFKMVSKPTPETDVNEIHVFVLTHPAGKY